MYFWANISLVPFTQVVWTGMYESVPYVKGWLSNGKESLWGHVSSITLPSDIIVTTLLEEKKGTMEIMGWKNPVRRVSFPFDVKRQFLPVTLCFC